MGKLVKRYDYQPGSSAVEMTHEGFMRVSARAARVGVLRYKQMDGTVLRELVPPDELFKPESMATLAMKPVTNNHPTTLLDSENATLYQVGFTGETVKNDEEKFLAVSTVITDKKTISDAEGGKVEVSPGYVCELDFTPGVFDGEEYDAVQRNRRYNHLAIVSKGRAGPTVRLRLDAEDAVQVELSNQPKENKTMKVMLGGKEFEVAEDLGAAIEAELAKAKEAPKAEMDEMKAKLGDACKEKDALQAKADGLESEVKKLREVKKTDSDPAAIREAVKARLSIEKVAAAAGVEKFDELDDVELKKAIIKADSPEANLEGKSIEYINARFDVAAESISASEKKANEIGGKINGGKRESESMDADEARQKMIERQQNAWKKGEEKKEA